MPPKSRKKRHVYASLEMARAAKKRRKDGAEASGSGEVEIQEAAERDDDLGVLDTMSDDALDAEDEAVDPTFDLDSSMKSDTDHIAETFCEDWVSHLDRDDHVSLGIFLCFQLTRHLEDGETKAAELAGMMIGKSDKTVREWRKQFFENDGVIPSGSRASTSAQV